MKLKQLLLTTAGLLFLTLSTAGMHAADTLSGQIIESHGLTHHKLLSNNKTYDLQFTEPTELKKNQTVEVKGSVLGDDTVQVDEVIVINKSYNLSS